VKRAALATWLALAAAVVLYLVLYLLTSSWLWSALLAAIGSIGLYLMLDARTKAQVDSDTYADDAEEKTREVLKVVKEIRDLSRQITAPAARGSLESACASVSELLERVKVHSPDSLYSSASQIGAHLASLHGVVTQYLDIQRKPTFYKDPKTLMAAGDEAFRRFSEFALESVHLVNAGDLATYRANLETVAPPKLPELT
jgi:hypothetical protein